MRNRVPPLTPPATPWRRSSRCGPNGGNCVEVRVAGSAVGVRDSKRPDARALVFAPDRWAGFVSVLRA
ncbi:DUF397 domain-containing protein [Actinokineospora enzanensis]|uniref:DUF397 domain-containing protein n=1 Tax=Actinokineospora enzanensis TaxID=155975 RepID=UPI0004757610|nr:DUF397 domain-containing protein [Actinokineospora enzanensis]